MSTGEAIVITAPHQLTIRETVRTSLEHWYFTGMAVVMIVLSVAGFMPAILSPAGRRGPLSTLAAVHGIMFFAWLGLFLAQSLLVAVRRVAWHRVLGPASLFLLALMIPVGLTTTTEMIRRGFDLSGDQHVDPHPVEGVSLDAPTASLFNFAALLTFGVLAVAAICYRCRPEEHKRLMLFANISLMSSPITHLMGHFPRLGLSPATILVPYTLFLLAVVGRDYLLASRIRPLTATLAIGMFIVMPIQALLIGPSHTWHRFAEWLAH